MKNLFAVLIFILISFVLGFLFYQSQFELTPNNQPKSVDNNDVNNNDDLVACTMEARICIDGTAVGRIPPTCEFQACPYEDQIVLSSPYPEAFITSPLEITGKAIGSWYFEGSFSVVLKDYDGNVLTTGIATAQGDWMTSDFVPFKVTLTFKEPKTDSGFVVFEKANPSDLPDNEEIISMPINFE